MINKNTTNNLLIKIKDIIVGKEIVKKQFIDKKYNCLR